MDLRHLKYKQIYIKREEGSESILKEKCAPEEASPGVGLGNMASLGGERKLSGATFPSAVLVGSITHMALTVDPSPSKLEI